MKYIKLGDLEVSRIGLGAMGMSHGLTGAGSNDAESVRTIHRAVELGVTFIDNTAADSVRLGPEVMEKLSGLPPAAGATHSEAGLRMLER